MNTVPRIPSEGAIEAYNAGKRSLEEAAEQRALQAEERVRAREELKARQRERFTVSPERPAARVRAEVDDLLVSELGFSVLALVEMRDNPKVRAPDRIKAAQELIARVLGPVQGPQVTVNVDSSLMALARKLDGEGLEAVRARARGELPPGPPSA